MLKLALLASGRGSNVEAILRACADTSRPLGAKPVVLLSNVRGARCLDLARDAGVPTVLVEHGDHASRDAFDRALLAALAPYSPDLICLAGFMRVLGTRFLATYPGRVLNIHPSLLPSFPGLHGARDALRHGVRIAGCTVHLVEEGVDSGPIVAQAAVPVLDTDTEESLARRILEQEHRIYPEAIALFAKGAVRIEGRRVLRTPSGGEADGAP